MDALISEVRGLCDSEFNAGKLNATLMRKTHKLCDNLEASQKENERIAKMSGADWNGLVNVWKSRAEKAEAELLDWKTPKDATPVKSDKPVTIGRVKFGAGCTVWHCPKCGDFITPAQKHCWNCGQAVCFSKTDLPHGD